MATTLCMLGQIALTMLTVAPAVAREYHVSPAAKPTGDGSTGNPWDLASALIQKAVEPGDLIWLHGGTYGAGASGPYFCRLNGTAEKPIIVRQAIGERAIVDGAGVKGEWPIIIPAGGFVWFWGFEMTSSDPQRVSGMKGSAPADYRRSVTIMASGSDGPPVDGVKFINMVFHDCAGGPGGTALALNQEAYGCLVYYNGWDAPDRGHGHAFYWQNDHGTKRILDNIIFDQFSHGIHVYGSSRAFLNDFDIEGNILFNNGALSKTSGYAPNILIGGGRVAENLTLQDNYTYDDYSGSLIRGGGSTIGYAAGCKGATVKDNYFIAENGTTVNLKGTDVVFTGNTLYGNLLGFSAADYPENIYVAAHPSGLKVVVRPNKYEPGRANICVYNWEKKDAVEANVSMVGLKPGEKYEVRDAENFFGPPVASGTFSGKSISLPMNSTTVASPVGDVPQQPVHTSPEFGVFVLMPVR